MLNKFIKCALRIYVGNDAFFVMPKPSQADRP